MAVIHVLKNGQRLTDIKGHVVKQKEVPTVYELMDRMNQKRNK
jgi:hypothetical protein